MIGPIGITLRQAEDHFDFIMDLTETQRVCWKITRPDGKSAMMVPVNEVPPVPEEIQNQVEEFKKSFMSSDCWLIAILAASLLFAAFWETALSVSLQRPLCPRPP